MLKIRSKSLIIFLILISGKLAFAQEEKVWVDFIEYDSQQYGFDAFQYAEWKTKYEHFKLNNSNYYIPNKSVLKGAEDSVLLILNSNNQKRYKLTVKIADSIISHTKMRDGDTIAYQLPAMDKDYSLDLFYGENKVGRLNVFVYEEIGVPVVIIPMTLKDIDPDSLQQSLDAIYAQAGVRSTIGTQIK